MSMSDNFTSNAYGRIADFNSMAQHIDGSNTITSGLNLDARNDVASDISCGVPPAP